MCKPIPGNLDPNKRADIDIYNEIRKKLNERNGVINFKKEYCIGPQITGDEIKQGATAKSIIKSINPVFTSAKKQIKKVTDTCITSANKNADAIAACNITEKNEINRKWREISAQMKADDEAEKARSPPVVTQSGREVVKVVGTRLQDNTLGRPLATTVRSQGRKGNKGNNGQNAGKKTKKRSNMVKNKTHKRKQKLNKRKTIKNREQKLNKRKTIKRRRNNVTRRY